MNNQIVKDEKNHQIVTKTETKYVNDKLPSLYDKIPRGDTYRNNILKSL